MPYTQFVFRSAKFLHNLSEVSIRTDSEFKLLIIIEINDWLKSINGCTIQLVSAYVLPVCTFAIRVGTGNQSEVRMTLDHSAREVCAFIFH